MYCPKCGEHLSQNQNFCPKCGENLSFKKANTAKSNFKVDMKIIVIIVAIISAFLSHKMVKSIINNNIKKSKSNTISQNIDDFDEEKAKSLLEDYYLYIKEQDYDSIEKITTKEFRLENSNITDILSSLPKVKALGVEISIGELANSIYKLNNSRFNIDYISDSFEKVDNQASYMYTLLEENSYYELSGIQAQEQSYQVEFKKQKDTWLINSIVKF